MVSRLDVEFRSEGPTVRAWFYKADGDGAGPPVVLAGGWCYVREIVMPTYAQAFAQAGVSAMIFDYRNLGVSDGDNRQHLDPWAQIRDYQNAISFLERREDVDPNRIGVWGISYSGGHALILAAIDPRVKSIVSQIPVIDGYENMRRAHARWSTAGFGTLSSRTASSGMSVRASASICLMRPRIRNPKFPPGRFRRRSEPSLRSRTPRRRSIKTEAQSSRSTSS